MLSQKKAALYVNVGDYKMCGMIWNVKFLEMSDIAIKHFDDWDDTTKFANDALTGDVTGIHGFFHKKIFFEAVYCTNLFMRSADVLVHKAE